eukprot:GHVN01058633.1.p2 GENE.GHVN01058633.1~~GHVN01058633.1.p2  ORF type:complete len:139 (-),score=7.99 GHVN01058633.1:110-526(-)
MYIGTTTVTSPTAMPVRTRDTHRIGKLEVLPHTKADKPKIKKVSLNENTLPREADGPPKRQPAKAPTNIKLFKSAPRLFPSGHSYRMSCPSPRGFESVSRHHFKSMAIIGRDVFKQLKEYPNRNEPRVAPKTKSTTIR